MIDHELYRDEVLDRQVNGLSGAKPAKSVFEFATRLDLVIIAISCISAAVAGGLNPLLTVLYGQLVGSFNGFKDGTTSATTLKSDISRFTLFFVYLAIGMFVSIYITTVGFFYTGERITKTLRRTYLKTAIRQNISFFDTLGAGEITTRITTDISLIQEGITGNLSVSLTAAATFISALVIAFVMYWKLAFVLCSTVVALTIFGSVGILLPVRWTKESLQYYSNGASVAEEAISSIRHITAFGIQEKMVERYDKFLQRAERPSFKANSITALMMSASEAVPYFSYGLSFWEGSRMHVNGEISVSGLTTSTLAIVIGAWAVERVAPNAKAFVHSIASAAAVLESIARKSPQDPLSEEGTRLESSNYDIKIRNLDLVYPSRREVTVLKNLSMDIPACKTTAIIGASGSGKSSIIGLLERFYTPTKGDILLGDHDIQNLSLHWLRSQMSLVGQEPTLFNTTIFENIVYGLDDETFTACNPEKLRALVEDAATKANAHNFVSSLPEGYQTLVGEKGAHLSGGQRQRICIARAIIKNPRVLLLDEATSALDTGTERAVQKALSLAAKGRTTIVIAHRLSTIRDADNIIVMAAGRIIEQGTHDDLMAKHGQYEQLVEKQRISDQGAEGTLTNEINSVESDSESFSEKAIPFEESESGEKTEAVTLTEAKRASIAYPSGSAQQKKKSSLSWNNLSSTVGLIQRLSRSEVFTILTATIAATLAGLGVPAQSVIFASMISSLSLAPASYLRDRVDFWALMYLVMGLGMFAAYLGQGVGFAYAAEKLTHRTRRLVLSHILRQEVAFFDTKENSIGTLTSLLSSAPSDLNGLSGSVLGALLTFLATIIGGIVLSVVIGWKLALVCTATIPLVAGFGWIRLSMLTLMRDTMKKTHQDSAAYASEAISAIRTVASLNMEARVLKHYNEILSRQSSQAVRSILQASALYAASQSVVFLCAALAFWYGGNLIANNEYSMFQFFICFASLISGAQIAGAIFSHAPGMSRAIDAAQDLNSIFDRQPSIDSWDTMRRKAPEKNAFRGAVEFRNVNFSYASRKDRLVINDFSMKILPGQFIALVGPSGCGKSTLIGLLERFFDPTSGQILVNGEDISKLEVGSYRSLLSLVGQEPTLYSGTIRDNLILGSPDDVSEEDIVEACKAANIYDVIISLPQGFDTETGSRGIMLSGGQRQRIAIARALLRNTKILLLDEATAALDSASEAVVQEALNKAAKKRTTIAVAHRLRTIEKADLIFVLDAGRLVEVGKHSELMRKGGVYKELVKMQNMGLQ
ncbi:hypothetical protein PENCOP_c015G04060 [Penicillium coprophilum]|uniref:Leptomycin B resistance protein pmd1 n=1 Tax=Penicillium coprophilum TaxID=36646 RepID=A0A1V6U8N7_9EURO|nr:hypothetical protein PENCOP_c015G04060 [Penicillium coprophilum]